VKIQPVQVGPQVGSEPIILQGVNASDRVVVGGVYARPGATVKPEVVSSSSTAGAGSTTAGGQ
jgi:hypothetical protein